MSIAQQIINAIPQNDIPDRVRMRNIRNPVLTHARIRATITVHLAPHGACFGDREGSNGVHRIAKG